MRAAGEAQGRATTATKDWQCQRKAKRIHALDALEELISEGLNMAVAEKLRRMDELVHVHVGPFEHQVPTYQGGGVERKRGMIVHWAGHSKSHFRTFKIQQVVSRGNEQLTESYKDNSRRGLD